MTSLATGEFFCFGCNRHKPNRARGEKPPQITKPYCQVCVDKYNARQTKKGQGILRRKHRVTQRRYKDEQELARIVKYITGEV